jgi:hypothetical protein
VEGSQVDTILSSFWLDGLFFQLKFSSPIGAETFREQFKGAIYQKTSFPYHFTFIFLLFFQQQTMLKSFSHQD